MIFDNAIDQVKAETKKAEVVVVKLGEVTSVTSGGRAYVKHYGENTASTKLYTYIDGYFPEVGDKVALLPQGNTYIILGRISDSDPEGIYATEAWVEEKFLPIVPAISNSVDMGSDTKLFKNLYLTALIGAKYQYSNTSANNIAWASTTDILPNNDERVNLGSASKQFNKLYAKDIYLNGTALDPSAVPKINELTVTSSNTDYTLKLSVVAPGLATQYEKLEPSVNNRFDLGSGSYKLRDIYFQAWSNGTRDITFDSSHNIVPDTNNSVSLGTSSKQYKNIYGQNIYVDGTAVTSDRRKKEDIGPLDSRYDEFFKSLNPVSFRYKDGTSGRKHTGFIAQEVEEAAEEARLSDKDIAVVVRDQEDNYYLRYEEIIAIQTNMIQKLMARVESLEARVNKLESERSKT